MIRPAEDHVLVRREDGGLVGKVPRKSFRGVVVDSRVDGLGAGQFVMFSPDNGSRVNDMYYLPKNSILCLL